MIYSGDLIRCGSAPAAAPTGLIITRSPLRQLTYTACHFGAYELRPAWDEKELYRSSIALPIAMLFALARIYKYKTPKSVAGELIP